MLWCINSFNSLKSRSVQTVLVYCHLILKVFRRTLHEHSVTSSFRSLQGGQEIASPALTWQSLIGRRVITARSWVKPKRLRTVGRGGWHSFSVYIFACLFNFGPKPVVVKVHRSSTWVKVQIRILKYYSSKSKSTAFSILLEWKYKSTQFFMYLSKKVLIDRFILQFYIDYFI